MSKYLIVLGNSPHLGREELLSLLKFKEVLFQPPILVIETDETIPYERLGGTVKVGEVLETTIVDYLKSLRRDSIDFGISKYGGDSGRGLSDLARMTREIKRELVEFGVKARFVLPREGTELSSVVVKKQKLVEFLVTGEYTARTIWVQDFEQWNRRDYDRPEVEAHIGMLPLKVARMMLNISGAQTIHDPFCGVGTILAEGAVLDLKVSGSDINPQQVARAQKNLKWLGKQADIFISDAKKISERVKRIDAIVTEVDLGPRPGLVPLYLECFKDWQKITSKVVIALPGVEVVDKAVAMGYILEAGPFIYARPQAKVKRHILVFKNGAY